MTFLRVDVVAFVDESFPGFVRCAFADADGNRFTLVEKVPVVTTQELWTDSIYPQPGTVPCVGVEKLQDDTGRALARVSICPIEMGSPDYPEQFVVHESQLSQ